MVLATSRTPALWLLISILRRDPLPLVGILIVAVLIVALVVVLIVALVVVLIVVLVVVLIVVLIVAARLIELLLLGIFAVSKLF